MSLFLIMALVLVRAAEHKKALPPGPQYGSAFLRFLTVAGD
jgi:hypothetical protein